jgi:putative ABC transport system ATP-binding protein
MEKTVPAVKVVDVHKDYYLRGEVVHALRGINLEVPRGEYLSVMGPSGSGKTTLFNMVGGIDRPTKGDIFIDGIDLSKIPSKSMAWLRCRKIGYIFQTFNLIPVLTAKENVALPMVFLGVPKEEREKKAAELGWFMVKPISQTDHFENFPSPSESFFTFHAGEDHGQHNVLYGC